MAETGNTSKALYFGLNLHFAITHFGEIISYIITPEIISDNNFELGIKLSKGLSGKLFGDKGNISESAGNH